MPAPQAAQLEGIISGALKGAQIDGENASGLAKALAKTTADTLGDFLSKAQVMPGIPAAVDPITGSGSTAGPGMLMPPPAGGPAASQIESAASAALKDQEIKGENADALAKVVGSGLGLALQMFTAQVMVAPGMAVAGFTTTAPGSLL